MKKSIKLSIAMALMMGATAGINAVAPSTASAEISDKFRMEVNGYHSYTIDNGRVGYNYYDKNGNRKNNFWGGYTRLVLQYNLDKNTRLQARLHSNYENVGDFMKNQNETGAYFDQSFLEFKDRPAKMTYTIGKKGAYMGQGMVYNSSGNLTGGSVQWGNWWEPNNFAVYYGDRSNGDRVKAVNGNVGLAKNVVLSATYVNATKSIATNEKYYTYNDAGTKRSTHYYNSNIGKYTRNRILSFGVKAKLPEFTIVGEYAHNMNGSIAAANALKGWYVEVYTGPTNDATSGMPVQKPGTNMWSLKYQDIGYNATYVHNTTFYDDRKGFRLNYGHTFKKGLSADIAIGRYKNKGVYSKNRKGDMENIIVAEVCYKFR